MAVRQILAKYYEGLSGDVKPTGVLRGSTFMETDTRAAYVSTDGTNWIVDDERIRLSNEDGTFVDIPGEFDATIAAI